MRHVPLHSARTATTAPDYHFCMSVSAGVLSAADTVPPARFAAALSLDGAGAGYRSPGGRLHPRVRRRAVDARVADATAGRPRHAQVSR